MRSTGLGARFGAAMAAGAWFFVLLAITEAALNARSFVLYAQTATPSLGGAIDLVSIAVPGPISILLPAAILFWRPNAWRTAPALMFGCVFWTTTPALALVVRWVLSQVGGDLTLVVRAAPVVAALIARFGGLLAIVGLERIRTTTRATWLPVLVLAVLALVVWQSIATAQSQLTYYDGLSAAGQGDPLWALLTVASATESVAILLLVGVVWSTLSAVRAGEPPRVLWMILFVSSAVLCVVVATAHAGDIGLQSLDYGDLDYASYAWLAPWLNPANAIGWTLMTGAFVVAGLAEGRPELVASVPAPAPPPFISRSSR